MKLVIDIPEKVFKKLEHQQYYDVDVICNAILSGTPLPDQPCENCISREATKEMLTETWTKYVPMELDVNLSFVLEKISELPSVTPQPYKAESEGE